MYPDLEAKLKEVQALARTADIDASIILWKGKSAQIVCHKHLLLGTIAGPIVKKIQCFGGWFSCVGLARRPRTLGLGGPNWL